MTKAVTRSKVAYPQIPVESIRSMYVPGEDKVMCLFKDENADTVKQVNDAAKIPYKRVVEAMDLTP